MSGKLRELTGNTIIFSIGTIGSKLVLFFLVPLYTNVLSTDEYGVADFVQSLSQLVVPIISIMIQDAVLRFGLSKNYNSTIVLKNAMLVSTFGMIIGLLCIPLFSLYGAISEWSIYLYFISIVNMMQNILCSYAKTINKNLVYAISGIISALVLALSNIVLLLVFKMGIEGYLLSIIISHLFSVLYIGVFTRAFKDLFDVRIEKMLLFEMMKYSIPLIVNSVSWWIVNASDRIMIEHYTSNSDLGLYTAASKIPALLSLINSVFLQAWTISVIREYENKEDPIFSSNVFKYYSLLMFIGTSIIVLILKVFMSVYVGAQFQESWRFVPLLLYGTTFYGFSLFFGAIYSAAKENVNVAVSTIIAAIINIGINLLLMRKYGVVVASVSTAISYLSISVFRIINSRRLLPIKLNYYQFAVNSIIVLMQVIMVTIGYNIYIVSVVSVLLLIIINLKNIIAIPQFLFNSVRKNK